MELLNEILPTEVVNKIVLYMRHPIVDIIERDRNNLLCYEGYGQTWDEFVGITLYRYKKRCRKKPKHCQLIKDHIQSFKWVLEYFRETGKKTNITSFYKFCFRHSLNKNDLKV